MQFRDRNTPLGDIRAELQRGTGDVWRWSLQGELQHAPLLGWLRRLNAETGLIPGLARLDGLVLEGRSEVTATVEHPDVLIFPGATRQDLLSQFSLNARASNEIAQLDLPATLAGAQGEFDVGLRLAPGRTELVLGPIELAGELQTGLLRLAPELSHWLRLGKRIGLRWHNPGEISIAALGPKAWSLQLHDNLLVLGNRGSELRFEALHLEAVLDRAAPERSSVALSGGISTRAREQQLPRLQLVFNHPGSSQRGKFDLSLMDAAESLQLTVLGELDTDTGVGSFQGSLRSLDLPAAVSTVMPLLQQFDVLDQPVEVLAGSFSWNTEVTSRGFSLAQLQQRSELMIQALEGSFGEYRFSGVELAAAWTGIEQWQTLRPLSFSMEKLFVGFELVDTRALIALPVATSITRPMIRIEQFSSGLFGGRVYQPIPQLWDFGASSNSLSLAVQGWQLGDIVSLQQDQDISAQGILDGELPARFADGRLIIDKGYLRARAPGGTIRYVANEASMALAASSPQLGLALQLLNDFRYQSLDSRVELDKNGNLLLGLALSGRNPAQYEGHPIEFNIKLEQNIDPLLQSLRLSDKLVEQLDKRLR